MANKTEPTAIDPRTYLEALPQPEQRADSLALLELMAEVSGEPPTMWGPTMIGFGSYHYRYASGREGVALRMGFAPRKGQLVIYGGDPVKLAGLLEELGPHTTGKGCIYVKRLADVDAAGLRTLVTEIWTTHPDC